MSQTEDQIFVEPVTLARWMLEKDDIWQEALQSPDAFAHWSADKGINVSAKTVLQLWQLRLLRADLVLSPKKLRRPGLVFLEGSEETYVYADNRPYRVYSEGLGKATARLRPIDPAVRLLFHPFRLLVLHQYNVICRWQPSPNLLTLPGSRRRLLKHSDTAQKKSGSSAVVSSFARANAIAALAVASEPCAYPHIFSRWRFRMDQGTYFDALDSHWDQLKELYRDVGEAPIKDAWKFLCNASWALDRNERLHELLRLARNDIREKQLTGPLAGALFLKTEAETLRRVAEATFQTEWPEEGENWEGRDYKQHAFGARRIFDGDRNAAKAMLTNFWPGFGLQVRWYVEGSTEFGALREFFGPAPVGIDIVNLRGRFDDRLPDLLRNDLKNGIYSVVSVDGDLLENHRLLQAAAKEETFFGLCHISTPDFEFANFALAELQEILWQIAEENGAPHESHVQLLEHTKDSGGKAQLQKGARKLLHLNRFSTNEDWGRRLMRFAKEHPKNDRGIERPIIRAANDGRRGMLGLFSHRDDVQRRRVDPHTLELVERKAKASS